MPTQIATFLFTDVEGSSRLWEDEPERMARAMASHDRLLLEAVASHGGRVVKSTGDGILAAFVHALPAVQAAAAIQMALADPAATAGLSIAVRCGLNTGPAEARADDYFGDAVNRAARIMSAAHGGQVLASRASVDETGNRLPPEFAWHDLGTVRLRGLRTRENLLQLVHPGLRKSFPALTGLEATPHNLPHATTTFVGRERERADAGEALDQARLVTLLGTGGIGKTRLAVAVAEDRLDAFPDGVWFVDLAPVREASVTAAVAAALGVREQPGRTLVDTLATYAAPRTLLLVLDNCEHVVAASASLAHALLRAAPALRILATSREALHVDGEHVRVVPTLPVPRADESPEALAQYAAVRLFAERARSHRPDFALNDRDAPAIAAIVARVEGIPLAIELAAARVRSLPVGEINALLRDRYRLLTSPGRAPLERQQTLRATVDWSFDLLDAREQALFARLGVFAGGFSLAAAEAVGGAPPIAPAEVLDLLASLVDKSLVALLDDADGARYRMLETLRDYALGKLALRGEAQSATTRHRDYFFAFTKSIRDGMKGHDQGTWIRRADADHDNLRAAMANSLGDAADPVLAVKFAVALMSFWLLRGHATEGRAHLRAAMATDVVRENPQALAHALYVSGALAASQSEYAEALRMLEEALALRRAMDQPLDVAASLSTLAFARLRAGDPDGARRDERDAIAIFRGLGDRVGETIGLLHLGQIEHFAGDLAAARSLTEQSRSIAREVARHDIEAECELTLGDLAFAAGDVEAAHRHFERSASMCRECEDQRDEAVAMARLGRSHLARGDVDAALARLRAALPALRAFEMNDEATDALEDMVRALSAVDPPLAAAIGAAADVARAQLALPSAPGRAAWWSASLGALRSRLGGEAYDAARRTGEAWSIEEAIARATAAPG